MLVRVICDACGETGSLLIENESHLPNCPRCSGRFTIEKGHDKGPHGYGPGLIDEIDWWIAQPSGPAAKVSNGEARCPWCDWLGVMSFVSFDSQRGESICPKCLAVYRPTPPETLRTVACPSCGQPVEYSDLDRGRTIICRECNYFLGCLVPLENWYVRVQRMHLQRMHRRTRPR